MKLILDEHIQITDKIKLYVIKAENKRLFEIFIGLLLQQNTSFYITSHLLYRFYNFNEKFIQAKIIEYSFFTELISKADKLNFVGDINVYVYTNNETNYDRNSMELKNDLFGTSQYLIITFDAPEDYLQVSTLDNITN